MACIGKTMDWPTLGKPWSRPHTDRPPLHGVHGLGIWPEPWAWRYTEIAPLHKTMAIHVGPFGLVVV
jgi:hypothetical protein